MHYGDLNGREIQKRGDICIHITDSLCCTVDRDQDDPHGKKCKKAKWLSEEALQIAVKRREAKSKVEKKIYKYLNAEFQKLARRDKKAFLSDQCKEIEEKTQWERLEISSRKLEIPKEYFMQRWA